MAALDIDRMREEFELYASYAEETQFSCAVLDPPDEIAVPVLAIELDEDEEGGGNDAEPHPLIYMFMDDSDEEEGSEKEAVDDDIFDETAYIQVYHRFPLAAQMSETLLDALLLTSALNQQLPLGSVYISSDRQINYRYVFAVDVELGLTREVFLETLYVFAYLIGQISAAFRCLLEEGAEFESALERYLTPVQDD